MFLLLAVKFMLKMDCVFNPYLGQILQWEFGVRPAQISQQRSGYVQPQRCSLLLETAKWLMTVYLAMNC
ncbi:MAG: hypothetical protein RSD49_15355 [Hafnia sp.]